MMGFLKQASLQRGPSFRQPGCSRCSRFLIQPDQPGNKQQANHRNAHQEQAQWQHLLEKIKACALKSTDEDTATSLWAKEGELPKGIDAQALESFWRQGPDEGNEEQLREACIAPEIHGEIESPAEDK